MAAGLNFLVIEDNPADLLLVERHLRKQGLPGVRCHRIADIQDLDAALQAGGWDLVLADYNVPRLRFEDGLALVRRRCPDLPLVLISGSVGEEKAVELLKLGVWDFVLKGNLLRLVPVVERTLKDAAEARARRAAEQALRESEERLRLTLEAAGVVAWELNVAGREVREAGPVAALFGQPRGFRHPTLDAFIASVHPEDRPRIGGHMASLIASGDETFFSDEFRIVLPDGGLRWIMSAGNLLRGADGRPERVLGIARDITRWKQAEEAALRANAELLHTARLSVLGEVASTIAHEVNQPIGAAKLYLQTALFSVQDAGVIAILDKIDRQLTRATDTIRKVREFAADRALDVRPENVRALVGDACALGLLDAAGRNVVVAWAIPEGLPPVAVDRVQIQQVLINIIRNAVEAVANADHRKILISAAPDPSGGMVEIAVADTGPGIAETIRARLFTAFTTTKPNGTGLGLSTSHSIISAHGGRLWAEDRAGGGTVFRMTLPVEERSHA